MVVDLLGGAAGHRHYACGSGDEELVDRREVTGECVVIGEARIAPLVEGHQLVPDGVEFGGPETLREAVVGVAQLRPAQPRDVVDGDDERDRAEPVEEVVRGVVQICARCERVHERGAAHEPGVLDHLHLGMLPDGGDGVSGPVGLFRMGDDVDVPAARGQITGCGAEQRQPVPRHPGVVVGAHVEHESGHLLSLPPSRSTSFSAGQRCFSAGRYRPAPGSGRRWPRHRCGSNHSTCERGLRRCSRACRRRTLPTASGRYGPAGS